MKFIIEDGILVRHKANKTETEVVIPNGVTSIGTCAFACRKNLINIVIPNSVTTIGICAFADCNNLTNIVIPNSVTSILCCAFQRSNNLKTTTRNYKAFKLINNELVCMNYHFKPNEWSEKEKNIELCKRGYHYCTNLFEIFDYYSGKLDEEIAVYECEIGDKIIKNDYNSKCVTNRIKPVKRLYREDIIRILNEGKNQ